MGSPESEQESSRQKSLDHRISTTLERLERLTAKAGDDGQTHLDPATVEEAVTRLKRKVAHKDD